MNNDICAKCGEVIYDRWEQRSCSIDLKIKIDCMSTTALFGKHENINFDHPAIDSKKSGCQELFIKTGSLNKYYLLCWKCHRKFVGIIGDFLKYNYDGRYINHVNVIKAIKQKESEIKYQKDIEELKKKEEFRINHNGFDEEDNNFINDKFA